jgi:hypothetical protein
MPVPKPSGRRWSFALGGCRMQAGHLRPTNVTGLRVATASVQLLLQLVLGFAPQGSRLHKHRVVRRSRYGVMVAVVMLVTGHVGLNG